LDTIQQNTTGRRAAAAPTRIEPEELIESGETAKLLRVKAETLTAWRCHGRGPTFVKVGRKCFYRREDIAVWLSGQRRQLEAA
jgi:Helix-turn-helix domain